MVENEQLRQRLIDAGTKEKQENYVKKVMELYGKTVHWEKLELLKKELINEYKTINL